MAPALEEFERTASDVAYRTPTIGIASNLTGELAADGLLTAPWAGEALASLAQRLGHRPVRAKDTPGFIVHHAGRGYGTEALRILGEGVAAFHDIDRILRDSAGFRLGPFELLDLTGLDVSHPVMESIYRQYYDEPRYRPSPITGQRVNAGLFGKVYFPRLALPISKALGLILDLGIALVVVVVVTLIYGVSISSMVWLVPAFLLLGVVTAFAIATLLAAINVKYRDVQVLIPVLVQILFFAIPVIYSGSTVGQTSGEIWSYLYYLNPMATVLDGTRWALLAQPAPGVAKVLISTGSASVLLVAAVLYFRRAEQFFADVI